MMEMMAAISGTVSGTGPRKVSRQIVEEDEGLLPDESSRILRSGPERV
jgi:hypothetical protein